MFLIRQRSRTRVRPVGQLIILPMTPTARQSTRRARRYIGDPNYGVDEWEGWSFANKSFWIFADDQGRSSFTNGVGTVAVADADEWDDLTTGCDGR